jgi:UDPglucose 6-dehydrogenase
MGYDMRVLRAVEEVNEAQKELLFEKLNKYFSGDLEGKTVAMWGLAFKPETDDMREAPALVLIDKLLSAGVNIKAYDPIAMQECQRRIGDKIEYCKDMYDAASGADAVLLVTEWKEFRVPSWSVLKKIMNQPTIFDGRNIYNRDDLENEGFYYSGLGK